MHNTSLEYINPQKFSINLSTPYSYLHWQPLAYNWPVNLIITFTQIQKLHVYLIIICDLDGLSKSSHIMCN